MPDVTSEHLSWLLLTSMRYAIGRRTYAPSYTAEIIRKHWGDISAESRALLLRDLDGEIKARGSYLGDPCDVATWTALYQWMLQNLS
jgi:hypothetical protein